MYYSKCHVNHATCAMADGHGGAVYLCGKCIGGTLNPFLPTPLDARAATERLTLESWFAKPSAEHGR